NAENSQPYFGSFSGSEHHQHEQTLENSAHEQQTPPREIDENSGSAPPTPHQPTNHHHTHTPTPLLLRDTRLCISLQNGELRRGVLLQTICLTTRNRRFCVLQRTAKSALARQQRALRQWERVEEN